MNNFVKALGYLSDALAEADVIERPIIEIRFSDRRDRSAFEAWLKYSLRPDHAYFSVSPSSAQPLEVYGFPIKLADQAGT